MNNNNNTKDFLSVHDKTTSPRASKKMGKRNIKAQVKKFRMETKGECRVQVARNARLKGDVEAQMVQIIQSERFKDSKGGDENFKCRCYSVDLTVVLSKLHLRLTSAKKKSEETFPLNTNADNQILGPNPLSNAKVSEE
jgi:hypothetical protein